MTLGTKTGSDRYVLWRGAWWPVPAGGSGDDDADDSEDGDTDDSTDDESGGDDADDTDESGGDDEPKQFTQAELDARIQERLERERKKRDKAVEKARQEAKAEADKAGKEAGEAANEGASDERVTKLQQRAVKAEAKNAALAAGVSKERMGRFLKLVDLGEVDVDDDGEVDEDAVNDAVKAALEDVPEFAAAQENGDKPKRSGGGHKGDEPAPTYSREQIAKMSDEEFEANQQDIQEAIKAGRVK